MLKAKSLTPLLLQLKSKYASSSYSFIPSCAFFINVSTPAIVIFMASLIFSISSLLLISLKAAIDAYMFLTEIWGYLLTISLANICEILFIELKASLSKSKYKLNSSFIEINLWK